MKRIRGRGPTVGPGVRAGAVVASSLLVLAGTAMTSVSAPAEARLSHSRLSRSGLEAQASVSIPPFIRNLARRWARRPPRRVLTKVGAAVIKYEYRKWLRSRGRDCDPPFPGTFCSQRLRRWGLGQALWHRGRVPGVWNNPFRPRYEVGRPLTPRFTYWLTCWTVGERLIGPYKNTNVWYWAATGGYVSDALLYTGAPNVIPGVDPC